MKGYLLIVHNEEAVVSRRIVSLANCKNESDVDRLRTQWQERVGDEWTVLDSRQHPPFQIPHTHPAWIGETRRFGLLRSFWSDVIRKRVT